VGINKPVSYHWLGYNDATHVLESGKVLRNIQELLNFSQPHIGTFSFARHTGRPFAKPKEPLLANALMTFFTNIKLTLPKNFKNRK